MTIFLVGFMGSGKTTLGKRLAAETNAVLYDTDREIEKQFGLTISEIFAQYGEEAFRRKETEVLHALPCAGMQAGCGEAKAGADRDMIVVTGGGLPCHSGNMEWMLEHGRVVWLNPTEEEIFERLKKDDNRCLRPLLKDLDDEGLRRFIAEKLKEREPVYARAHRRTGLRPV